MTVTPPGSKTVYNPPRPNLGPEPLIESPPWLALGLGFSLVLSTFLVWRRLRRNRRAAPTNERRPLPEEGSDSPREHMVAWSQSIRESMAATFGSAWLAKTTEELAADPILTATIGPESTAQLLTFLAAADHAKFANAVDVQASALSDSELRELAKLIANAVPSKNEPRLTPH